MLLPLLYVSFPNWVIGVLLATVASIISNLGLNLQKLSHIQAKEAEKTSSDSLLYNGSSSSLLINDGYLPATAPTIEDDETSSYQGDTAHPEVPSPGIRRISVQPQSHDDVNHEDNTTHDGYTHRPLWQFGLFLVVFGSIFDFVALVYAAQSIVAPLGSLTLVSNTIFAPYLLHERITKTDIIATMTIVCGSVVAVVFASHEDKLLSLPQLFHLFTTLRFVIYLASICTIIFVLSSSMQALSQLKRHRPSLYIKYIRYHRAGLASLSGVVGAQSVLLAKCFSQCIADYLSGHSVLFFYWQSYAIVGLLFLTIVVQIRTLNEALQEFDATTCVPIFQSTWILFSVLGGMIFFEEFRETFTYNGWHGFGFVVGVLLTIGGVYALSQRDSDADGIPLELDEVVSSSPIPDSMVMPRYGLSDVAEDPDFDRRSVSSIRSAHSRRDQVGQLQVDLLLLPLLQQRQRHGIFASPSFTSGFRQISGEQTLSKSYNEPLLRSLTGGSAVSNPHSHQQATHNNTLQLPLRTLNKPSNSEGNSPKSPLLPLSSMMSV